MKRAYQISATAFFGAGSFVLGDIAAEFYPNALVLFGFPALCFVLGLAVLFITMANDN